MKSGLFSRILISSASILTLLLVTVPATFAGVETIPLDPGIVNGIGAEDIVVNPVTNRIYTANEQSDSVSVVDGSTDTLIKNIAVGDDPQIIGVNSVTNKIYVVNIDDETVSVIDGATDTVVATIAVGAWPFSLLVNEGANRIYVSNFADNTVSVSDGATDTLETTIAVGWSPTDIGSNGTTKLVYVANYGSGDVSVIDGDPLSLNFNTVIATMPSSHAWGLAEVAVNETTNTVYALFTGDGNSVNASVEVFDGATNTLSTGIPLPAVYSDSINRSENNLNLNENTNYVYAGHENGISIIDGSTNTLVTTVAEEPQDIEVNENTNLIYAALDDGPLTVIDGDPSSLTFHEVIAQGGIHGSEAIAINTQTNLVYVSAWDGGIQVFDGATNTPAQYIVTGGMPQNLAIDYTNNRVWVAHTGTDGIKYIDTLTHDVTGLALGTPAGGVLFNPNTNRLYVAPLEFLPEPIKVLDIASPGVEAEIPLVNRIEDGEIVLQTKQLYLIDGDQLRIIEADPDAPGFNTVIATIPVGNYAEGIAVNEHTGFVYVGEETGDGVTASEIYVINGATNTLATKIEVGIDADQIAINGATNLVYTANDTSQSISVIDSNPSSPTFHTVIDTIPLASHPEHLLVNEATNRLYVNVDGNQTIVVIDGNTNTIEVEIPLDPGSDELDFATASNGGCSI